MRARCRAALPAVALRATAGVARRLFDELLEGALDLVVVHAPELRQATTVAPLADDRLILVTTDPEGRFRDRYILFDWRDSFRGMHAEAFPGAASCGPRARAGSDRPRCVACGARPIGRRPDQAGRGGGSAAGGPSGLRIVGRLRPIEKAGAR